MKSFFSFIPIIIALAFVVSLTGCDDISLFDGKSQDGADITLTVTSYWGESAEGPGSKVLYDEKLTVYEDEKISPVEGNWECVFTVVSVDEDALVIKTDTSLYGSYDPESGINLRNGQKKFEITKGKTLYLHTLTEDAGAKYVIKFEGIHNENND